MFNFYKIIVQKSFPLIKICEKKEKKINGNGVFDFPSNSRRLRYLCFCIGKKTKTVSEVLQESLRRNDSTHTPSPPLPQLATGIPSCLQSKEKSPMVRTDDLGVKYLFTQLSTHHPPLPPSFHPSYHPFITSSVQASVHSFRLPKLCLFIFNNLKNYLPLKFFSIKNSKDFLNSLLLSSGRNR